METKIIQSISKVYQDSTLKNGPEFYDYDNLEIHWGNQDNYEILQKMGRGRYSEVFEGIVINSKNNNDNLSANDNNAIKKCVIKVLKPIRKKKIKREIKILQNLQNGPNIICLTDVLHDPASKVTSLIFEYINNDHYQTLYPTLTDYDARYYLYKILKALDFCHNKGIIHRDIKPHNIMINHKTKELRVIDWGLAEFYFPGKDYNTRVSSRYFKGPELLIDYQYYDYSLDIWSLGALFAGIIFIKEPFFQGNDSFDQLEKITRVLGTNELFEYLERYHIQLDQQFLGVLGKHPKKPFQKFVSSENQHLANNEAIDLLTKMLVYDHAELITAAQALNHQYFNPVRDTIEKSEKAKILKK